MKIKVVKSGDSFSAFVDIMERLLEECNVVTKSTFTAHYGSRTISFEQEGADTYNYFYNNSESISIQAKLVYGHISKLFVVRFPPLT